MLKSRRKVANSCRALLQTLSSELQTAREKAESALFEAKAAAVRDVSAAYDTEVRKTRQFYEQALVQVREFERDLRAFLLSPRCALPDVLRKAVEHQPRDYSFLQCTVRKVELQLAQTVRDSVMVDSRPLATALAYLQAESETNASANPPPEDCDVLSLGENPHLSDKQESYQQPEKGRLMHTADTPAVQCLISEFLRTCVFRASDSIQTEAATRRLLDKLLSYSHSETAAHLCLEVADHSVQCPLTDSEWGRDSIEATEGWLRKAIDMTPEGLLQTVATLKLARLYFDHMFWEKASEYMRMLKKPCEEYVYETVFLRGALLFHGNKLQEACGDLERAQRLLPATDKSEEVLLLTGLSAVKLCQSDIPAAESYRAKAQSLILSSGVAPFARSVHCHNSAVLFAINRQWRSAEEAAQFAVRCGRHKHLPDMYHLLALVQACSLQFRSADSSLSLAIRLRDDHELSLDRETMSSLVESPCADSEEAEQKLMKARLKKERSEVWMPLLIVAAGRVPKWRGIARLVEREAQDCIRRRAWIDAEWWLRGALRLLPDVAAAIVARIYLSLSRVSAEKCREAEAQQFLSRGVETVGKCASVAAVLVELAECKLQRGELDEAAALLQRASQTYADTAEEEVAAPRIALLLGHAARRNWKQAEKNLVSCTNSCSADPSVTSSALFLLAQHSYSETRYAEAQAYITRSDFSALPASALRTSLLFLQGKVHERLCLSDAAIAVYESLAKSEQKEDRDKANYRLGRLCYRMNDLGKAETCLRRVWEQEKAAGKACYYLALVKEEKGDVFAALECLRKAKDYGKASNSALFRVRKAQARLYLSQKDSKSARKSLEAALIEARDAPALVAECLFLLSEMEAGDLRGEYRRLAAHEWVRGGCGRLLELLLRIANSAQDSEKHEVAVCVSVLLTRKEVTAERLAAAFRSVQVDIPITDSDAAATSAEAGTDVFLCAFGDFALAQKEFPKANSLFADVVSATSDYVRRNEALFRRCQTYALMGQYSQAESCLREARNSAKQCFPQTKTLLLELTALAEESVSKEMAEFLYTLVSETAKFLRMEDSFLGEMWEKATNWTKAAEVYEKMLDGSMEKQLQTQLRLRLASIYKKKKEFSAAKRVLSHIVAHKSECGREALQAAFYQLARIALRQSRESVARNYLQSALPLGAEASSDTVTGKTALALARLEPSPETSKSVLDFAFSQRSTRDKLFVKCCLAKGQLEVASHNEAAAEEFLQAAIDTGKDDASLHEKVCEAVIKAAAEIRKAGNSHSAQRWLQFVRWSSPQKPECAVSALLETARCELDAGRKREAEELLSSAKEAAAVFNLSAETVVAINLHLALFCYCVGRVAEGNGRLAQELEAGSSWGRALTALLSDIGMKLFALRINQEARKCFERVAEHGQGREAAIATLRLGQLYKRMDEIDVAKEKIKESISKLSDISKSSFDLAEAFRSLALVHERQKAGSLTYKCLSRALEILRKHFPTHIETFRSLVLLGELCYNNGLLVAARTTYLEALTMDAETSREERADLLFNLALAHSDLGEWGLAERRFVEGLNLGVQADEKIAETNAELGEVYIRMERWADALQSFTAALQFQRAANREKASEIQARIALCLRELQKTNT